MRAVLCDIEGTTTDIRFVQDMLFPYAAARIPSWIAGNAARPEVSAEIAAVQAETGARTLGEVASTLLGWMAEDRKATQLKAIQGLVWEEGYREGLLRAHVYPDVAPALASWRALGLKLGVYSSGSIHAQKLLFGHTITGDLRPQFDAWFDTTTGPKREPGSYRKIADALALEPAGILFLSDVVAELDAAAGAGMRTCLILRDGLVPSGGHPTATSFFEIEVGTAIVRR